MVNRHCSSITRLFIVDIRGRRVLDTHHLPRQLTQYHLNKVLDQINLTNHHYLHLLELGKGTQYHHSFSYLPTRSNPSNTPSRDTSTEGLTLSKKSAPYSTPHTGVIVRTLATMETTKNKGREVWAAIVRHAKEHHDSVNAAVVVYYPQPLSLSTPSAPPRSISPSLTPRSSFEKPPPGYIPAGRSFSGSGPIAILKQKLTPNRRKNTPRDQGR
jgi:hypothetical protein